MGGIVVSIIAHRTRTGVQFFATVGLRQVGWITVHAVKSIFWPIVLAIWFLRGRPGPRAVYGRKALRLQQQQTKANKSSCSLPRARNRAPERDVTR